jgi:hypothetical protein
MATCSIYKNHTLLGTGSITSGSASVTGWSATTNAPAVLRKNCTVAITSSTHSGSSFHTRCTADNGSGTLTLKDASPFAT